MKNKSWVLTQPEVDFRDLHMNSQMATKKASDSPPKRTTNTPPTLSILRAVTDEDFCLLSSAHCPPPFFCFHHFSFSINSLPVSCSLSIAWDNRFRCFESKQTLHTLQNNLMHSYVNRFSLCKRYAYPQHNCSTYFCIHLFHSIHNKLLKHYYFQTLIISLTLSWFLFRFFFCFEKNHKKYSRNDS